MDKKTLIAQEFSQIVPIFLRHMFPYVFHSLEIPPSQVIALVSIQEHEICPLKTLTKEMHVSAPTVSGIIDRLEKGGYVKRVLHNQDRRIKMVSLTAKGEKVVAQLRINIKKRWEYILSKMPVESGETILGIMKRLTQGFKDGSI